MDGIAIACAEGRASIIDINQDYTFSRAGWEFPRRVEIRSNGSTLTATSNVEFVAKLFSGGIVSGLHIDFDGFCATNITTRAADAGGALLFEAPFHMHDCSVGNMAGTPESYEQYAVYITPFNGEAKFTDCKFYNVTNLIDAV